MSTQAALRIIKSLDALSAWVGKEVACSDWLAIEQSRIQQFADAARTDLGAAVIDEADLIAGYRNT